MKFAIDLLPLVSYGTMSFAETSKTSVNLGEGRGGGGGVCFFCPTDNFWPPVETAIMLLFLSRRSTRASYGA